MWSGLESRSVYFLTDDHSSQIPLSISAVELSWVDFIPMSQCRQSCLLYLHPNPGPRKSILL